MENAHSKEAMYDMVGQNVGASDWFEITQEMIDEFAVLTHDPQPIHINQEAAKAAGLPRTIAHGFLTLSMLGGMVSAADITLENATHGFNYGFDKIRFIAPVLSGSRIRGRFKLKGFEERRPGEFMITIESSVEIEGSDKPAVVADWLTLTMVSQS